jgi:hypothetical protein
MKAKLRKDKDHYRLFVEDKQIGSTGTRVSSKEMYQLSFENCDEIFGVVDVEELANETWKDLGVFNENDKHLWFGGFRNGFNKAMELNKDKVFTLDNVVELAKIIISNPFEKSGKTAQELVDAYIQSLQQPTEIEVTFNPEEKDSDGCLILTKI